MSKLLIVDDEVDIREFAKNFFRKRNIDVLTASGGKEAIGIIEKEKPDLVLLDVRMEEMTGLEVLRDLRAKSNSVKVIMVTGVENGESIKEANDLGVLGYVHKPLVLEELEKVVLAELKR
ncbi:MAG TPA: response regulator [Candidatus Omnitrophota bacterium]|nr:response regulator [Candidatus Omnitrophota bacterium]HPD85629.1 response regulator [Candidatus Omnitrophota bacterium]HRZ04472.1 response regulator [Candidatus Omnitrophota bacterium]